uniref:Metallophosphoesterase 1 n=1 Tax=Cyprinus carpio TaxID=7962 RepID=A0A8C2FKM8_CYPCA
QPVWHQQLFWSSGDCLDQDHTPKCIEATAIFLLVNSVALHGDHCPICQRVEKELHKLSHALNCSIQVVKPGPHYPLYRVSDAMCTGIDAAPLDERYQLFQERYDVISKNASKKLLWWFKPRLILSGHTHHGCEVLHENLYPEISIPSFSWRNRNNPSFILVIKAQVLFTLMPFQSTYCLPWNANGEVL